MTKSTAMQIIAPDVVATNEQAAEYIKRKIKEFRGALDMDKDLMPALKKDPQFLMLRYYSGGPINRAGLLNFLTTPGYGFVVIFDSKTVWVHASLPKVPTKRMLKVTPNSLAQKKPRRR